MSTKMESMKLSEATNTEKRKTGQRGRLVRASKARCTRCRLQKKACIWPDPTQPCERCRTTGNADKCDNVGAADHGHNDLIHSDTADFPLGAGDQSALHNEVASQATGLLIDEEDLAHEHLGRTGGVDAVSGYGVQLRDMPAATKWIWDTAELAPHEDHLDVSLERPVFDCKNNYINNLRLVGNELAYEVLFTSYTLHGRVVHTSLNVPPSKIQFYASQKEIDRFQATRFAMGELNMDSDEMFGFNDLDPQRRDGDD